MDYSQPRQPFKSGQKAPNQKLISTCLHTPPRPTSHPCQQQQEVAEPMPQKQCPYHFSQPSHICLTCRRSICLRCAITYCQQHTIHPQQQILPLLVVDIQKLTIEPRIQDLELRLKQSQQRQDYLSKKISKIMAQVEENFQQVKLMIQKKKDQILQYFKQELQGKFAIQYRKYDEQLVQKLQWLRDVLENCPKCTQIEQLDQLANLIKKQVPNAQAMSKAQLKISKLIAGKDKLKISSIWSQQRLQQVLFEIENIPYKLKQQAILSSLTGSNKKKRVTTQISDSNKIERMFDKERERDRIVDKVGAFNFNSNSNSKNPFAGMVNSGSNSRFSTGRKLEH